MCSHHDALQQNTIIPHNLYIISCIWIYVWEDMRRKIGHFLPIADKEEGEISMYIGMCPDTSIGDHWNVSAYPQRNFAAFPATSMLKIF